MATPHVAGAVALLASHRPDLTASELKEYLLHNANSSINPVLRNNVNPNQQKISRCGLLDIDAAIEAATIVPTVPVTGITINPTVPGKLYTNSSDSNKKTVTLTATVSPANATVQEVEWLTNAPAVATVSSSVSSTTTVTAISSGDAQITAKAKDGSGVTQSVTVQVSTYATGITLSPESVTLAPSETIPLAPMITPSGASDQSVSWSKSTNSSPDITVSNGTVTVDSNASDGETATIVATANGSEIPNAVKATTDITVKKPNELVTKITITPSSLALTTGATDQLSAQVAPADATNKTVTWISDKPSVATVNQSGRVTAVGAGTATVTAKAVDGSNVSGSAVVTVTDPVIPVTGIVLSKYTLTLEAGDTEQLLATISPPNATNKNVLWSTANEAVANVKDGLVTAHGQGTTTITATAAGDTSKKATATVTVTNSFVPVTGLTLTPETLSLKVPEGGQLTATIVPANATDKTVNWQSSQPSVATVTQTGYVTAVSAGTVVITAVAQGAAVGSEVKDTAAVTVTGSDPFIPVTGLSVVPSSLDMLVGSQKGLEATVVPETATNLTILWVSTDPGVAKLGDEGGIESAAVTPKEQKTVTAVSEGSAIIRLTAVGGNNVVVDVPVTVRNEAPVSIPTLPPGNVTVTFLGGAPAAFAGLPLTCSVQTSAPVQNAVLLVTYPDGSVHFVDMQMDDRILTFTFTPPTAGTYTLAFTLIESDRKLSEPVLSLAVEDGAAPPAIDLSELERIGLSGGVLRIPTGQSINVQLSTALGGKFTSTPLPLNLVLTENGRLYGSVAAPGTYSITITVTTPAGSAQYTTTAVSSVTFTLVVVQSTSPTPNPTPNPTPQKPVRGGGGGGCDAGLTGSVWAILLTSAALFSRFSSRR
jgi:uncharacterized protein YjdB